MRHSSLTLLAGLLVALGACAQQTTPATGASNGAPPAAGQAAPASGDAAGAPAAAATPSAGETGDEAASATGSDTALERLAQLPAAVQLPEGKWTAGTNYKPLVPTQPTQVPAGKVEVVEVFWYGCPHCYALEPYIRSWVKNKPSYIEFIRLPVTWGAVHRAHARLYYTLQALGKLDALDSKVWDEIQVKRNFLASNSEAESLAAQVAFARANGIDGDAFANAWKSFGVQSQMQRADELVRRYHVEGVPLIVINGKYETDVGMAGSQAKLIDLINDLAASEKRR